MSDQPMNSSSIVPVKPSISISFSKSHLASRPRRVNISWPVITTICCSSLIGVVPMLVARSKKRRPSALPLDQEPLNQDVDKRIVSKGSDGGGGPIPNILSMAKWFLGSLLMFVPFYKNFLKYEDMIEKSATTALHVVEAVAEKVEDVAEDVANALPENSKLKKIAQTVDKIAEEVDKDAEVLGSLVEKVDDIVDKLDELVEPIIEDKIPPLGSENFGKK